MQTQGDKFRRNIPYGIQTFKPLETVKSDKIIDLSIRPDKRNINELRSIFMRVGAIPQATGSAYIEFNKTKVICGIYGPKQAQSQGGSKRIFSEKGHLLTEIRFTTFSSKNERRSFIPDKKEKEMAEIVTKALQVSVILDKFPKSVVEIHILILEDDGSSLSASINCATLALANAGIEMFDLVSSCSCGIIYKNLNNNDQKLNNNNLNENNLLILDPNAEEENKQQGSLTIAFMPSLNQVTQIYQTGVLSFQEMQQGLDLLLDVCGKIVHLMNSTLIHSKSKEEEKKKKINLN